MQVTSSGSLHDEDPTMLQTAGDIALCYKLHMTAVTKSYGRLGKLPVRTPKHLGRGDRQALAGADVKMHAAPALVVDLKAQGGERLDLRGPVPPPGARHPRRERRCHGHLLPAPIQPGRHPRPRALRIAHSEANKLKSAITRSGAKEIIYSRLHNTVEHLTKAVSARVSRAVNRARAGKVRGALAGLSKGAGVKASHSRGGRD